MYAKLVDPVPNNGSFGASGAASSSPTAAVTYGLGEEQAYGASATIASGVGIALVTATATMTLPNPSGLGNGSGANLAGDVRVVSLPLSGTAVATTVVPGTGATLNVAGVSASSFVVASGMTAVFTSAGTTVGNAPSWFVTGYYPTSSTSAGGCTANCTFTGTTVSPTFANSAVPTAFQGTGAFINGNSGQFMIYNPANGADQKAWDFAAYANGALLYRAVSDDNQSASVYTYSNEQ